MQSKANQSVLVMKLKHFDLLDLVL